MSESSNKEKDKDKDNEDVCAICHGEIVNGVMMDCPSTHVYCFSCICHQIKSATYFTACALCRGGSGSIIIIKKQIKNYKENDKDEKYSFDLFNKYYPTLLVKCFPHNKFTESAFIPRRILKAFIFNIENINKIENLYSEVNSTEFLKLYEKIEWVTNDVSLTSSYSRGDSFPDPLSGGIQSFGGLLAQSFLSAGNNHDRETSNNLTSSEPLSVRSVTAITSRDETRDETQGETGDEDLPRMEPVSTSDLPRMTPSPISARGSISRVAPRFQTRD